MKRWWFPALFMALGAIGGLYLSTIVPPRFVATGTQSLSVDYTSTGTLSDLDVDRIFTAAEDTALSVEVVSAVASRLGLSPEAFRTAATVRRTNDRLILSLVGEDQGETMVRVYLWLDTAAEALQRYHQAALQASATEDVLIGLTHCVSDFAAEAFSRRCSLSSADLDAEIDRLSAELSRQLEQAHGVSPALRLGTPDFDGIRARPLTGARGTMALSGFVLGLVLSICIAWVISVRLDADEVPDAEARINES